MSASAGRVLIVEDNDLNLELATDLLVAAGYDVHQARSGEEGLRLALSSSPDLILMDLRLPGLDGYTALERLRADPRTARIPTVALTAQAMNGDRETALAAGFDDYVSKPIDSGILYKTIARLLGRPT